MKPYETFGAYMDKTRYILPTDHPWNKPYGPGTAAKEEYDRKAAEDRAAALAWFKNLKNVDPTTKAPICDICGCVAPDIDHDLSAEWSLLHYAHPRPAVNVRLDIDPVTNRPFCEM